VIDAYLGTERFRDESAVQPSAVPVTGR